MELHRLRPGELDHEVIWLSVTVLSGAMALGWLSVHLPWPQCTFRGLFGIPCLTCGSTRAALAFFGGDFMGAWDFNPLATVAFGSIAVFDLYALGTLISNGARLRVVAITSWERRLVIILIVIAAGWNWRFVLRNDHMAHEARVTWISADTPNESQ